MALSPAMQKLLKGAKTKFSRSTGATKLKEGRTTVRIIQADPDKPFWAELGVHWIKEDLNGKPVAVVGCHDVTKEEPCAICTAIQKAQATAFDEDTKKLINEWRPRTSILLNALIRSGDNASEEPVILEVSKTVFKGMLDIAEQYGDEDINIFDPANGYDLNITRSGKGLDTEYTVNAAPKPGKAVSKEALKQLHDLQAYIEKEFFSGGEAKALRAIGNVTGITVKPSANALTSTASTVAQIEQKVEDEAEALASELDGLDEVATEEVVETPAEPDADDEEAELLRQLEAKRAEKAAKAAAAKPVETKKAATTAPVKNDELAAEDVDALMSELDDLV